MGDWQEIVALGMVALAAFALGLRVIRQWLGVTRKAGGCGGCNGCSSEKGLPKASPSATRDVSTPYPLLELGMEPSGRNRSA